jgi:DNA-binding GntR family transcriptional regulator
VNQSRTTYGPIAEILRTRINTRTYPPGSRMPSEAVLSAEFHVARTTLRRALAVLESQGLCKATCGRGRFVVDMSPQARHDARPHYLRIARDLRVQIERGDLRPGERLPSDTTVSACYGVSRSTARQAFAELTAAGLIKTVQGKGRFVTSRRP